MFSCNDFRFQRVGEMRSTMYNIHDMDNGSFLSLQDEINSQILAIQYEINEQ